MSNGKRAARRGRVLENAVKGLLEADSGYKRIQPGRIFAEAYEEGRLDQLDEEGTGVYASECPITYNIYGGKRRVDFILYHQVRWPKCLIIQCKWQSRSGSVDEKYPFEVLSIQRNEIPTIVVLDGDGFRQKPGDWLKARAGEGNLLHVMNQSQIHNFQSDGNL